MHKILWQRKQNMWMFIYRGCCPLQILAHAEKIADSVTACAVKNNLHSSIHTDRNALDLNFHFYVVEATLENKCMYFQDYSSKGRRKDVSSIAVLTDHGSELLGRSTGKENTPPGHSLIAQVKRGEQNLERVYFYLRLCVLQFFSSTFKIKRMI